MLIYWLAVAVKMTDPFDGPVALVFYGAHLLTGFLATHVGVFLIVFVTPLIMLTALEHEQGEIAVFAGVVLGIVGVVTACVGWGGRRALQWLLRRRTPS